MYSWRGKRLKGETRLIRIGLPSTLVRILQGDPYHPRYEDVPRDRWQPVFFWLYETLGIDPHQGYSCELFEIRPYDWNADCDCGWDEHPFWEEHDRIDHARDCIRHRYREFEKVYGSGPSMDPLEREMYHRALESWFVPVYRQHGRDTTRKDWYAGIAVACTCDRPFRLVQALKRLKRAGYPVGHARSCRLLQPNFVYHPTDFRLWWYKYPLRAAERSQRISDQEFERIIHHCVQYVRSVGVAG